MQITEISDSGRESMVFKKILVLIRYLAPVNECY